MGDQLLKSEIIRWADLRPNQNYRFHFEPDAAARRNLGEDLGLLNLRKYRFTGSLTPHGKADWHLVAQIGATVVQACVATLEPVTTRIDEPVERLYMRDLPEPQGDEFEIPEDDRIEPVPEELDLAALAAEALTLALPAYPRADGAPAQDNSAIPPGAEPIVEDKIKPFAGLAALRDQLTPKD